MGRNKFTNQVGRNEIKRDKKNKELGLPENRTGRLQSVGAYYSTGSASPYTHTVGIASKSRTALDTRPAKSDSSTLHAILITPADLVAWRQNLTERFGDLNAATRTARRTVLNSTFWAEQIRSMA